VDDGQRDGESATIQRSSSSSPRPSCASGEAHGRAGSHSSERRNHGVGPGSSTRFIAAGVSVALLTLYDDVFSPYARKVRFALYGKDVPFERVRALHGDCSRTDFMHVNPRAEVPALVDAPRRQTRCT